MIDKHFSVPLLWLKSSTSDLGHLILQVLRPHPIRHTKTSGRGLLNEWPARHKGRYLHITH